MGATAMTDDRILSARPQSDDLSVEATLRPRRLDEYIGQERIKDNLRIAIAAAELQAGRNVCVILFDPSNPNDAVLAAVWT